MIGPSHLTFRDYARDMMLVGTFAHANHGAHPFTITADGMLKGFAISLQAVGGQLNGPGVGPAWPFYARLTDASTDIDVGGVSGHPFDLDHYDVRLFARGPNLADLGYLFGFSAPNSTPYHGRLRARSDGRHFSFSSIAASIGKSDVGGWIRSDHSLSRRVVLASFQSQILARGDVDALLSKAPPRAQARTESGAVRGVATGHWLLPDSPFGLERLRANDFDLSVAAARTTGYALPLRRVATRIVMTQGLLRFRFFRASLYGGQLEAVATLDARHDPPSLEIHGNLEDARFAAMGLQQPPATALNLAIQLAGVGRSVHAAAATARGEVSLRVDNAVIPRRAAWMLGGDVLRAFANVGGKNVATSVPVLCAAISLRSQKEDGVMDVAGLSMKTALGAARGAGSVDLGRERLSVLMQGRPSKRQLAQLSAPIRLDGPFLRPRVEVLPGATARSLGLKGGLGRMLTPLTNLLPISHNSQIAFAPDFACGAN